MGIVFFLSPSNVKSPDDCVAKKSLNLANVSQKWVAGCFRVYESEHTAPVKARVKGGWVWASVLGILKEKPQ